MHKSVTRFISVLAMVLFLAGATTVPAVAKPYAVNYSLKGILNIQQGVPCLYTADGRVFKLLMDLKDAKKFDGKSVSIAGKVEKSDEVESVKVKNVEEIPEGKIEVPEVEHEAYQRPAKLLANADGIMTVSNLRIDIAQDPKTATPTAIHTWADAKIDTDKVVKAYLLVKPFAPKFLAAHTLLAFDFEQGGVVSKSGKESKDLVLTIEAYKKIGQSYGLIKTMKKNFDIVWVLTTIKNYAELNVNFNKSSDCEIVVYPIRFNREQTKALLTETIKQACVNRQGEYYNTLRNNCTNNLVILLNRVLPEDKQIKLWAIPSMIYNPKATMPLSVVKTLKKKGIIGEPIGAINREHFVTDVDKLK